MLRVVAMEPDPYKAGTNKATLSMYATDTWAVCCEHIDEGATKLVERNDMNKHVLIMRPEFD